MIRVALFLALAFAALALSAAWLFQREGSTSSPEDRDRDRAAWSEPQARSDRETAEPEGSPAIEVERAPEASPVESATETAAPRHTWISLRCAATSRLLDGVEAELDERTGTSSVGKVGLWWPEGRQRAVLRVSPSRWNLGCTQELEWAEEHSVLVPARTGTLQGMVVDDLDRVVPAALVQVWRDASPIDGPPDDELRTDDEGRFSVDRIGDASGRQSFAIRALGPDAERNVSSLHRGWAGPGQDDGRRLRLVPALRLHGLVLDPLGEAVYGAVVTWNPLDLSFEARGEVDAASRGGRAGRTSSTTRTDEHGRFDLGIVPIRVTPRDGTGPDARDSTLTVRSPWFLPYSCSVDQLPVPLVVDLQDALRLNARVVDEGGRPIAGARVDPSVGLSPVASLESDAQGQLELHLSVTSSMQAVTPTVTVRAAGFASAVVELDFSRGRAERQEIVLETERRLRVRCLDFPDLDSLEVVEGWSEGPIRGFEEAAHSGADVDIGGLGAPPWRLRVFGRNTIPRGSLFPLAIRIVEREVEAVEIRPGDGMENCVSLYGNAPLPGAQLELQCTTEGKAGWRWPLFVDPATGAWEAPGLSPGRYTVIAVSGSERWFSGAREYSAGRFLVEFSRDP